MLFEDDESPWWAEGSSEVEESLGRKVGLPECNLCISICKVFLKSEFSRVNIFFYLLYIWFLLLSLVCVGLISEVPFFCVLSCNNEMVVLIPTCLCQHHQQQEDQALIRNVWGLIPNVFLYGHTICWHTICWQTSFIYIYMKYRGERLHMWNLRKDCLCFYMITFDQFNRWVDHLSV